MERLIFKNEFQNARLRQPRRNHVWTPAFALRAAKSTYVFEKYGGLEMTGTYDLLRVNLAKAILLLLFPPKYLILLNSVWAIFGPLDIFRARMGQIPSRIPIT
jgi:hypothetical protein